jgi:hypothetical protein
MNVLGMSCLFGSWGMFFQSVFHRVQSIDLIPVEQIPERSDPPDSDLPDVHGRPARTKSTAAQHPNPPPMVVALERPDSEAESEALPFVGWTLT